MNRRTRVAMVAGAGGVAALVALVIWLTSWSDADLARWSAVATVVAGVVAVAALAVAIAPIWPRGDGKASEGKTGDGKDAASPAASQPPAASVIQHIHGDGTNNVVGEGTQVNLNLPLPPGDGR